MFDSYYCLGSTMDIFYQVKLRLEMITSVTSACKALGFKCEFPNSQKVLSAQQPPSSST